MHFSATLRKVTNVQNAHIYLKINKANSPAIPFIEVSRRFAASAATPANYYTRFNPPRSLHTS